MKIAIEIFEDGQKPVTCARNFKTSEFCPQLLSTRFGTAYQCRLFGKSFGTGEDCLETSEDGYIIPHKECLLLREE